MIRPAVTLALLASVAVLVAGCGCRRDMPPAPCETDLDCADDGRFCTAPPVCTTSSSGRVCIHGGSPCRAGEACDERLRRCVCDDPGRPECTPMPIDAGQDAFAPTCEERAPGNACAFEGDPACGRAADCNTASFVEWAATAAGGAPGRGLPVATFPGGYCAARCDATRLNDECEPCAVCSGDFLAGRVRLPLYYAVPSFTAGDGACRARCTPSRTGTGCDRAGYTCDLETLTCMEACSEDRQCQIVFGDADGDGSYDLFDRGESYPAFCDRATGRCRTRGTAGARIGDPCTEDFHCEDDGYCLRRIGSTTGVCSRLGCRAPGFECPPGSTCDLRAAGWDGSACLPSCRIGVEDGTPAIRGSRTGGSPDCGTGRACVWNGSSERGDPRGGSCTVGNYNDRTTPNIGAPCRTAADCDSPFGYGVCLFSEYSDLSSGICSVQSCGTFLDEAGARVEGLLPGVAISTPICDPRRGEICVNLSRADVPATTYCLDRCASAAECAPGYACTELLASLRVCWPTCSETSECRTGARCETLAGEACTDPSATCYCSDRSPR